ncbi:cell-death-related nuclease 7-like [Crassostrea virginica]
MEAILASLVFLISFHDVDCSLSCKNPQGNDVDWFIIYKVPKRKPYTGGEFFYIDEWLDSFEYYNVSINTSSLNPLYRTLNPIYNKPPVSYAMYNDQPPVGYAAPGCGHSKGVYAFDRKQGFWIVSSVPNFPAPLSDGYIYIDSQLDKSQTIICVTLKSQYLEIIKSIFHITIPRIYDAKKVEEFNQIPSTTKKKFQLYTVGGTALHVFVKSLKFEDDIYSSFIGPTVRKKLLVQTWMHQLDDTEWVMKVYAICFCDQKFTSGVDHSKWVVSESKRTHLLCIGDINRQETQFKRGGLVLCFEHANVAASFRNLYNSCLDEQEKLKEYEAAKKKEEAKLHKEKNVYKICKKIKKQKKNTAYETIENTAYE